jgi:membrane associated rhomboid family serine protease
MVTSVQASVGDESTAFAPPATLPLRVTADARRLETWLLALRAQAIPALLQQVDGTWVLHVLPTDLDAARRELDAIDAEEVEARRAAATPSEHERFHSRLAPLGGALFALLLVALYVVTGPSASRSVWFIAGASDASRVLAGEWWRTITALTLHADSNHVLSNVAIGTIVVTMVMRRTGVGLGAALVVLAGALGNAVNAWGYGSHHNSIGFSTAVFGAIGILGGLTYAGAVRDRGTRRGRPAWTAIAGALALLAMLGASERTDMLAHLFGTVTGIAVGLAIAASGWRPRTWMGQAVIGVGTLAVVVGAWVMAFAAVA